MTLPCEKYPFVTAFPTRLDANQAWARGDLGESDLAHEVEICTKCFGWHIFIHGDLIRDVSRGRVMVKRRGQA